MERDSTDWLQHHFKIKIILGLDWGISRRLHRRRVVPTHFLLLLWIRNLDSLKRYLPPTQFSLGSNNLKLPRALTVGH